MVYVLVVITVFTNAAGIASETRFHEFATERACEVARAGIERGVYDIKGQVSREVFAACFPKSG